MKRACLFLILILLSFSLVIAAEDDSSNDLPSDDSTTSSSPVSTGDVTDKAYQCIDDKIDGDCSKLSLEEQIFAYLATGDCRSEIMDNSQDEECWPKGNCNIEMTAKAMLALGSNDPKPWLDSKKSFPDGIDWFLQIESTNPTSCKISYDTSEFTISIAEDRSLSAGAGSCLSLSESGDWLRVSPNCYGKEIKVSCDESFLTNLLYRKTNGQTIHVPSETSSASASGFTTEKVESYCLKSGSTCDYEGTLWAALALDSINEEYSEYLSYLVSMSDENRAILPESFLYHLTGSVDFKNTLLTRQKSSSYWDEGNRFYDTAVAMLGLKYESSAQEVSSTKEWLMEVQGEDGCWNGNVLDTSFILYSVWGRTSTSGGSTSTSCTSEGYYCTSTISCTGEILNSYTCPGAGVCCTEPVELQSCFDLGGEICGVDERCSISLVPSSDSASKNTCCLGTCIEEEIDNREFCSSAGGVCGLSCEDGFTENDNYQCSQSFDLCCIKDKSSGSLWWIILLIILIIIVALGIVFRKNIALYIERFKPKSKPSNQTRPGMPPSMARTSQISPQGPPGIRPPQFNRRMPQTKAKEDIDDVLKKLKELGS